MANRVQFLFLILNLFFFSKPGFCVQDKLTDVQKQSRLYRQQGWELQTRGDIDAAISYYQKAIILDPNYVVAYNDLGVLFEAKVWTERAKEMYLKAIAVDPTYPNSYSNLALVYEEQKDFSNAIFYWKKRIDSGNPEDHYTKIAKQHLDEIMRIHPETYHTQLQTKVKELSHKEQEAGQLKAEERLKNANIQLSTLQLEKQQLEQKLASRKETLQNDKAGFYQELGTAYTQAKLFNLAIQAYENALKFGSKNAEVHYNLGLLYKHTKDNSKKAVEHLKKYLQLNPEAQNRKEVEYLMKMLLAK